MIGVNEFLTWLQTCPVEYSLKRIDKIKRDNTGSAVVRYTAGRSSWSALREWLYDSEYPFQGKEEGSGTRDAHRVMDVNYRPRSDEWIQDITLTHKVNINAYANPYSIPSKQVFL